MSQSVSDPLKSLSDVLKADDRPALVQSLEDVHAGLSELVLHEAVPVGVRQLLETAKNARLYTYFVFPFHQVAEMLAYQALERALKVRWNTEIGHYPDIDAQDNDFPGLSGLLGVAVGLGWIRKEGFRSRRYRAFLAIESIKWHEAFAELQRTGVPIPPTANPTDEEIDKWIGQIDVPHLLATFIPDFRNELAHGSARLSPTSDLPLSDVCDAINMLFDGTPSREEETKKKAKQPGLHGLFKPHLKELEAKRRALVGMKATTRERLPKGMPARGIYLFSENGRHLYVGRSNAIRKRIGRHCRSSAKHNMASFAFLLARESTKAGPATYKKGQGRAEFLEQEHAKQAFAEAKARIRRMEVRFVEESDPVRQTLLEVYVSAVHGTPYNDFDTH